MIRISNISLMSYLNISIHQIFYLYVQRWGCSQNFSAIFKALLFATIQFSNKYIAFTKHPHWYWIWTTLWLVSQQFANHINRTFEVLQQQQNKPRVVIYVYLCTGINGKNVSWKCLIQHNYPVPCGDIPLRTSFSVPTITANSFSQWICCQCNIRHNDRNFKSSSWDRIPIEQKRKTREINISINHFYVYAFLV